VYAGEVVACEADSTRATDAALIAAAAMEVLDLDPRGNADVDVAGGTDVVGGAKSVSRSSLPVLDGTASTNLDVQRHGMKTSLEDTERSALPTSTPAIRGVVGSDYGDDAEAKERSDAREQYMLRVRQARQEAGPGRARHRLESDAAEPLPEGDPKVVAAGLSPEGIGWRY